METGWGGEATGTWWQLGSAELQNELWSAVLPGAASQPTPPLALVVFGMNDVLNSQGYTQGALWNRIPIAAWALMEAIAICCDLLIGYQQPAWRVYSRDSEESAER